MFIHTIGMFMSRINYIIFLLIFVACSSNQDIKKLSPIGSVTDFSDNIFISDNWNIQEYKDHFYLNDYEYNKIIVLDSLLEVSNIFGEEGKGPGEFSGAGSFVVNEDSIYVYDAGGLRINVFTRDGEYAKTINLPPTNLNWSRFSIINQKLYLPSAVRSEADFFITDLNGKILKEVESHNRSVSLNKKHILGSANHIVVLNQVEPILAQYTGMGEFISDFDLREIEELNELWNHYRNKLRESKDGRNSTVLFKDATINGSSLYILCSGWPGRDNYAYILNLEVGQNEIQANRVFKIKASDEGLSLFDSITVKENRLYAVESISGNISKYDLAGLF